MSLYKFTQIVKIHSTHFIVAAMNNMEVMKRRRLNTLVFQKRIKSTYVRTNFFFSQYLLNINSHVRKVVSKSKMNLGG